MSDLTVDDEPMSPGDVEASATAGADDDPARLAAAEEMSALLRRLSDRLLWVVTLLGSLAVAANTWGAASHGWSVVYFVDMTAFVGVVSVLLLRRRLPPESVFLTAVAIVFAHGIARLAALGLAGAGTLILAAGCAFVGVFFGLRWGLRATAAALVGYAIIGAAHAGGWLVMLPTDGAAAISPQGWLTQGGQFAALTVTLLVATHGVQQRLLRSLSDLRRRTAELRAALEQLGESERKYRLVSDNVTDVVFLQDADLRIVYASPSVHRLFGYEPKEVASLGLAQLLTAESLERAQGDYPRYFAMACEGPVDVPLMEYEYVRKDGTTLWGEIKVTFLRDETGKPTGSQGVLRDITRRKLAEQEREELSAELRQSEKMQAVGQLASGVAHDFNNQLAVILGYAELLGADRATTPQVRRAAEEITAAARRSADLTGQMLAYGRRGAVRSVAVDLHRIIDDVARLLERGIDCRVRIRTHLEAPNPVVRGDPSQLSTALLNLGLNARDAMADGGELLLATAGAGPSNDASPESPRADEAQWLEIRVTDNGVGMDETTCRRVFEPFFTTKPAGRGTGMGLAAVYGTVTIHGGTIRVDSTLGVGTTVTIRLPLCADEPEPTVESARSSSLVGSEGVPLLLVDDEPQVCAMTRVMLEQAGFRVRAFTDAEEAVRFQQAHPDEVQLAVLDLTMPTLTGPQCLAALRLLRPGLPALFLSGDTPSSEAKRFVEEGRCQFLHKPFTVDDLVAAATSIARLR